MTTLRDCIEINPSQKAIGSVIWLHGLGADGNDFVPIVEALNLPSELPLRFIFPHAPMRPVTINNGYVMRAWFDIYSLNREQPVDVQGISQSVSSIQNLIDNEVKQHGLPEDKIVLAGFSQGAAIVLSAGLLHPKPLAGIMALSGYLPNADKILAEANPENYATPIYMAHGTQDAVLPYALGESVYQKLEKNKYPVNWHSYVMGHSVCQDEIGDIAQWLVKAYE